MYYLQPYGFKFNPKSKGILKGKAAIILYWETGLHFLPDLHFAILDVLVGIETITIYYLNIGTDKKAAETLHFIEEKQVYQSTICYSEITFDNFY